MGSIIGAGCLLQTCGRANLSPVCLPTLRCSEYAATIQRFVETRRAYEWGLVCQALAGAMRHVLQVCLQQQHSTARQLPLASVYGSPWLTRLRMQCNSYAAVYCIHAYPCLTCMLRLLCACPLQDWELMVAQLEHQLRSGKLTLQALWYYVQPPLSGAGAVLAAALDGAALRRMAAHNWLLFPLSYIAVVKAVPALFKPLLSELPPLCAALKLVASLAAETSSGRLRGAALLDLLHARCAAAMGDGAAHRLALRLLRAAAEPYFSMLERWLCEGTVDDPYAEFMVQEDAVSE